MGKEIGLSLREGLCSCLEGRKTGKGGVWFCESSWGRRECIERGS